MAPWETAVIEVGKMAGWYAAAKSIGARIAARRNGKSHFNVTKIP
jgi:hypothetical protein